MRRARALAISAFAVFFPAIAFADETGYAAHAEDVVDYTLTARLDPASHTVQGEGRITWRNTSDRPVSELWVHLYMNGFKNDQSLFLSEPVGRFRGGGGVTEWGTIDVRRFAIEAENAPGTGEDLWPRAEIKHGGSEDETDARVPLPREVAPGETISIATTWDVKLPNVVERTGYAGSFHMIAQWFPKIARLEHDGTFAHFPFHRLSEFYADFGTYDVTMDVPDGFVIGATGPVTSTRVENGRRIERHVQSDVHDFAWTAWDRFHTRSEDIDGVHVSALFPPDYDAVADREMATIRFSLPYYQRRYGRYPYSVLTLVHPPEDAGEAGGMEYPTLITTGGPWFAPRIVLEPELVTAHEFGHQYFYGLMASNEMLYPFLDEGVNSFAEEDALGTWLGDASGGGLWGISVSDIAAHVVNARSQDAFVAEPAYAFPTGGSYGSLVYSKTAVILETFKRVYGEEKFWAAMTDYTKKWRFSHPTPDDFIACFYDKVSPDAASELRAALFERGAVDYVVRDVGSREITSAAGIFDAEGKRATVKPASRGEYEGWVLVSRRGPLRLPVDIDLILESGARERRHWDGDGETTRIVYRGPEPLRFAIVDPDQKILLDENRTNNNGAVNIVPIGSVVTQALVPRASRTLERLSYYASLLLELLAP